MRVPVSWLREYVDLPAEVGAREIAERLIRAGLEVETVDEVGADITGPLVVGRVLSYAEETHSNGKTIRWCSVDVGETDPRGIVCGARNFAEGDLVPVALPGAVAHRWFRDHRPQDLRPRLRRDDLLGPRAGDRRRPQRDHRARRRRGEAGRRCRGVAAPGRRRCSTSPSPRTAATRCRSAESPARRRRRSAYRSATLCGSLRRSVSRTPDIRYGWRIRSAVPSLAATTVVGFDPSVPSPRWLARRVQLAGMRPISLGVDVTNYVMLEVGQPIHGWDRALVRGPLVVRRAEPGEKLQTLDGMTRALDPEDLVVTDDSGPVGLGGVMGGSTTELSDKTTEIVVEAAYWDPVVIARTSRRHKLSSEASKRFERGADPAIQTYAAQRVAELLVEHGGGRIEGATFVGSPPLVQTIVVPADHASLVAGYPIPVDVAVRRLVDVGCLVEREVDEATQRLAVTPPSWRPDLTDPNDLAEEVIRLEGYDQVPSVLPVAPPGRGLTHDQQVRRTIGRVLAGAGYVEVLAYPFVGPDDFDRIQLPADDPRRRAMRLANPLSEEEPFLRTTLLPGLLATARRNVGRGTTDLALFEMGLVFRPEADQPAAPRLAVDGRPSDAEIAALDAALPRQPRRVAVVLCGDRQPAGWWGEGRQAIWADAIQAARIVAQSVQVPLVRKRRRTRTLASGALCRPDPSGRLGRGRRAGGTCGRAAPQGGRGIRPPATGVCDGTRPRPAGLGDRSSGAGASGLDLPAGQGGRRPDRRRGRSGRRRRGGTARGRRRSAGGSAPVRCLHRYAGGAGPQVAGLLAAVPGTGPDADRHRGRFRETGRRGRGRAPHRRSSARSLTLSGDTCRTLSGDTCRTLSGDTCRTLLRR